MLLARCLVELPRVYAGPLLNPTTKVSKVRLRYGVVAAQNPGIFCKEASRSLGITLNSCQHVAFDLTPSKRKNYRSRKQVGRDRVMRPGTNKGEKTCKMLLRKGCLPSLES